MEEKTNRSRYPLLVQPMYRNGPSWERLAGEEGLFYEPLELSMFGVNGNGTGYLEGLTWYRESKRVRSYHGVFIDINVASGDEMIRRISRERCKESCHNAQDLGASQVIFHSSNLPQIRGGYLENWVCSCADFYVELAERFPSLTICVENSLDVDPEPLARLMRQAAHPRVGVCLDVGHANYGPTPLDTWFGVLSVHVQEVHLSDNCGRFDDHLPIGQGTVDWEYVDKWVKLLGLPIPLTFEVGGIEGVKQSLDYLKKHGLLGLNI